jgi:type I restriction enzyme S subunit
MSKHDTQNALVPRLRFPEYRDAHRWDAERLGSRGEFLSSLTGKSAADFDTGDATFIPYMNVFSNTFTDIHDLRSVSVGNDENQNAVAKGDVFFTVSSETPEDAGMSSVLLDDIDDCYLNSFCALFRFQDGRSPDPVFLGHMLRSAVVRQHLARGAQGATRYNISKGVFRDVPLLLPDPAEQQKIADCLGSLDDLITAEGRKLATLRDHKQGLMQQLFPREGESQPRLRFPEFLGDGDWSEASLGDLAEIVRGGSPRPIDDYLTSDPDGLNWLKIGDLETGAKYVTTTEDRVIPDALSRTRVIEPGDLILSNSMSFGRPYLSRMTTCIHDGWIAVRKISRRVRSEFLYYAIMAPRSQAFFNDWASGGGIRNLNIDIVNNLPAWHPSPTEQDRIADCLAALDNRIATQTEKLGALRSHKRGLMQQLFPVSQTATEGRE